MTAGSWGSAPIRVLHLVGSAVDEFHAELSRLYAADCLRSTADPARYEPVVAHVDPGGRWRFPTDLTPDALAAAPSRSFADAVAQLGRRRPDVALPQMFCRPGMTTYRALLDLLEVPYVGNRPEVMAIGAHKDRAKALVAAAGVRTPARVLLGPDDDVPATLDRDVVVKPADVDNSWGIALVRAGAPLAEAVAAARRHAREVLLEDYVELGREVRCGVVELDGELQPLPLEEYAVDPDTKPIRDAADKLARRDDDGALGLVAKDAAHAWRLDPADPVTPVVWEAALACHRALGCRDHSLFDFRIDPDGVPWFLEAGLYCSFARTSVVVTMAEAAGIPLDRLLADSLGRAIRRGPGVTSVAVAG